jgi:hypothetical protein
VHSVYESAFYERGKTTHCNYVFILLPTITLTKKPDLSSFCFDKKTDTEKKLDIQNSYNAELFVELTHTLKLLEEDIDKILNFMDEAEKCNINVDIYRERVKTVVDNHYTSRYTFLYTRQCLTNIGNDLQREIY